jgi:bifunctional DNA-binding transcriptional regulator/antitoxin component of YhaV-PrlF toxin-antitoxin module
MASNAYLTYHNGKLEVPEELQRQLQLHDGQRLEVVAEPGPRLVLVPVAARRTSVMDWKLYEGALADSGLDLNAVLEAGRLREIELDDRW